jgi:cell division protease FtsH
MYGLNDKIGNISYYDSSGQNDYNFTKPYSDTTADVIDKEVSKLIESMYVRTKNLLIENQDKLNELAELLLEKEVIFREDLERIFGKRKFETKADKTAEQIRLTEKQAQQKSSDNGQSHKELPSKDKDSEEKPKSDSGSDQNTDEKKDSDKSDKKEESTSDNTSK